MICCAVSGADRLEILRERYLSRIRRSYDSNLIKVLTGIRRCGKSIILKQIESELLVKNAIRR